MTKEAKLKESGPALVSPKARVTIAATVRSKSEQKRIDSLKKGSDGKSQAKSKTK